MARTKVHSESRQVESPPGPRVGPADRALQAMAEAARRARTADSRGWATPEPRDPAPPPARGDAGPSASAGAGRVVPAILRPRRLPTGAGLEKALRAGVAVTAALLVAVGMALVGVVLTNGSLAKPGIRAAAPPIRARLRPSSASRPADHPGPATTGSERAGGAPAGSQPAQQPGGPALASGAPQLDAVTPDAGVAGQKVTVTGDGLFSTDGQVQALVDGQDAPTDCPAQTTCQVTIPDLGGGTGSVPLTVSTAAGASNALTFSYGGAPAPTAGLSAPGLPFGAPAVRPRHRAEGGGTSSS